MTPDTRPHPEEAQSAISKDGIGDPSFAVYVHWPFCQAKCPYCDFNSHVRQGGINEARFRSAYLAELDHMRAFTGPREVGSVFFGGGTPSRMMPETTTAILERIARNWTLGAGAEITLEANPTSVEADKFSGFRAAGVNRVSVGLQALNDTDLKALGRTHDVSEGLAALTIAQNHFERVSFDLI
jgi:oxygen-independent coproporphyrinogen-3 oxidase